MSQTSTSGLWQECPWCAPAVKILDGLRPWLDHVNLSLGKATTGEILAGTPDTCGPNDLEIRCATCHQTRRILTDEGRTVAELIRREGGS